MFESFKTAAKIGAVRARCAQLEKLTARSNRLDKATLDKIGQTILSLRTRMQRDFHGLDILPRHTRHLNRIRMKICGRYKIFCAGNFVDQWAFRVWLQSGQDLLFVFSSGPLRRRSFHELVEFWEQ